MMYKRAIVLMIALISILLLAACQPAPNISEDPIPVTPHRVANPSAVYCEQQGGQYEIVDEASGGESGICLFPDGSQCDGWAFYRGNCSPDNEQLPLSLEANIPDGKEDVFPQTVSGWVGRIRSAEGEFDDYFELSPEGTGRLGITGMNPEIDSEISKYRDATGNLEWIFVWGDLDCDVPDYGGCQIQVSKLRAGDFPPQVMPIVDWYGTIQCAYFNSTPDKMCANAFVLDGVFPVSYGIWSRDAVLLSQLEQLRDSGQRVRVSGQLLSGVPDVNGNQIQVDRIELLEPEG